MADEVIEFAKVRNSSRVEVFSFFALLNGRKIERVRNFLSGLPVSSSTSFVILTIFPWCRYASVTEK